jgi:ribosomal protein S18 acetylase RimI-like enzyme
MKDVVSLCASEGYAAVRLDTYTLNWIAMGLYDGLGFERRGVVRFDGRGDKEYMCFELNLKGFEGDGKSGGDK